MAGERAPAGGGAGRLSWRRKAAWSAAVLAAFLLACEGTARLLTDAADFDRYGQRLHTWLETGLADFNACLTPDPELFWKLAPNRSLPDDPSRPFRGLVSNDRGWRGPPLRAERGAGPRLLFLGDSCTFGFGATEADTWPARTAQRLRARGLHPEAINAGVPGYASSQGLVLARRLIPELQPDVVVVTFGWNDGAVWDGRSDRQHARAAAAHAAGSGPWLERSRAYLWLRHALHSARRSAGWSPPLLPRVSPDEFAENLAAIATEAKRAGARVLFVAWPFRNQVADPLVPRTPYQQRVLAAGDDVLDLRASFRHDKPADLFLDMGHLGPAGYERVAEATDEALQRMGW